MTTPVDAAMMNPVELFMTADWVVKSVMIGLAAASIWSWTIIIDKAVRFTALNKRADDFEKSVQSGRSLEEVASQAGPEPDHALPRMLVIALSDWREARQRGVLNDHQGDLLLVRIDKAMNSLIARESQRIENGLGVLSVVATASPFIGLFGTVWGIMRAFTSIAAEQNSSLAVVAPGIAEALLATAIGAETGDHFHIEVAAYPEMHPQATPPDADLAHFAEVGEAIAAEAKRRGIDVVVAEMLTRGEKI